MNYEQIKQVRPCLITHLEVAGEDVELFPWNRDAFYNAMLLPLQCDDSLVEGNSFVVFRVHLHQALHKILQ